MSALEISIVVPTHNPRRDLLRQVLRAVESQSAGSERRETIIIDNASAQPLDIASDSVARIIREERLGLSYARLAGIAAAEADLVAFVDDDNILAPDYLAAAIAFMRAHQEVGMIGGRIVAEFATPPPFWAEKHLGHLALRDLGASTLISEHRGAVKSYDYFAPFGAGMVVRTAIARRFANLVQAGATHLVGRRGTHLGGCEDCEMVLAGLRMGYECAYVPELVLQHVIPASRLKFTYLQRLARQGQESWAEFLCRAGLSRPIPRWTVPLRQLKAFFVHRPFTRSRFITWRGACGYFAGAAKFRPPRPDGSN